MELRNTARGALIGALLGAMVIAIGEAIAMSVRSGLFRVALASADAALVLSVAGFIAALPIVLAVRGVLVLMARRAASADAAALIGGMAGATFAVLGAQDLVLQVFSGAGIRTGVVALSAAAGVVAGACFAAGAQRLSARIRIAGDLRVRTGAVLLALIATLIGAIALAPGLVEELEVPKLGVSSVPFGCSLIGAVWGSASRTWLRASLAAVALLLAVALVHNATGPVAKLALHIDRGSYATRWVHEIEETLWPRVLAPIANTGTCKPGVKPGPLIGERKAKPGAPNIVLIMLDSVRWDHMSNSGYKRDTTPNVKRWGRRAAAFASAYSPSSATRTSFRALFSGLYPSLVPASTGRNWWTVNFRKDQRTLARYLSDAGYRTVAAVEREEGFDIDQGFSLLGFDHPAPAPALGRGARRREIAIEHARHHMATLVKEVQAEHSRPLFAFTHLLVAHQPYSYVKRSRFGSTEIDRYDWSIRFADELINPVFEAIEAKGGWDDTYVVLSADHGQAFGEHGNTLHGRTVYHEETNVPLMVWGPGIKPGVRKEPVAALDIFPTLLELAGLGKAPHICGDSLAPSLRDPKAASARDFVLEKVPDSKADFALAYVRGDYKLVVSPISCSIEVFDLRKDKRDRDDISDKDPALTQELVHALMKHQRERGMNPASYCLE